MVRRTLIISCGAITVNAQTQIGIASGVASRYAAQSEIVRGQEVDVEMKVKKTRKKTSPVGMLALQLGVSRMHVRNVIYYNREILGATRTPTGRWQVPEKSLRKVSALVLLTKPATKESTNGRKEKTEVVPI
jgi:hypothetical protein